MSFDCDEAQRCLDDRRAGTLASQDEQALDVHLAICEPCTQSVALFEHVRRELRDAPLEPLPPELEARFLSGERVPEAANSAPIRWVAVAVAAAVALLLLWPKAPPPEERVVEAPTPRELAPDPARAEAPAPPRTWRGVRDGTLLQATAGSRVAELANGADTARYRLDAGEVVAHVGDNRPGFTYRVETGTLVVTATGTVFTVSVDQGERVRVAEGSVLVERKADGAEARLQAGFGLAADSWTPARVDEDLLLDDLGIAGWADSDARAWVQGLRPAPPPVPTPAPPRVEPTPARPEPAPAGPAIDELLREARFHRGNRDLAAAAQTHERILQLHGDDPAAWTSHVALAGLQLDLRQPSKALSHFDAYLERAPAGTLAEEARLGRIHALAALQRHGDVLQAAREYLMKHPGARGASEALELRAAAQDSLQERSGGL